MLEGTTFRTVSRGGVQIVILAAVAAAGVSVGRWVVPEASSGTTSTAPAAAIDVRDPWTVDGPAAVDPALYRAGGATSPLDQPDPWTVDGPAAVDPALYLTGGANLSLDQPDPWTVDGPAAVDPAIYAP